MNKLPHDLDVDQANRTVEAVVLLVSMPVAGDADPRNSSDGNGPLRHAARGDADGHKSAVASVARRDAQGSFEV